MSDEGVLFFFFRLLINFLFLGSNYIWFLIFILAASCIYAPRRLKGDSDAYRVIKNSSKDEKIFSPKTVEHTYSDLRHSAEAGDAGSQFKIGKAYIEGDGVKQDDREAFKWLLMAAEQGYPEAQSTIGRMYFMGEGTDRNNEEAYFWYSLAAKSGKPEKWAEAMARYLMPDRIKAIEHRVSEWKPSVKQA